MSDTILIRARAKVAGMQPGQVDRLPQERAQALIDGGYAVKVEALSERRSTERPTRNPSNQSGGSLGSDANPIPSQPPVASTLTLSSTPAVGQRSED